MGGGLLNLVAYGNQNVILNGNPSKTFFKCSYAKYTNFGLQKFRIDYNGSKTLLENSESHFSFKVPRYADLLMDTYLVVTLPTIWSPIDHATTEAEDHQNWHPYEFRWIQHIGAQMIRRIRFTIGSQTIQEYTGQYLHNIVERDFDDAKKDLYYKMIGHVKELYDPANAPGNNNNYPNAYTSGTVEGVEPSIRSRKLYIPLNIWFTMASKMALPLASLQYNELRIEIDMRPISELFTTKLVSSDEENSVPKYYKPNFNEPEYQLHRFLHPPLDPNLNSVDAYPDKRTEWNADIHLISTYAFLTEDEVRVFAKNEQTYLVKQAYTHTFHNIYGPKKIKIDTMGMVANWTWFFQRSDATLRNEWSNYTNWDHELEPPNLIELVDGDTTNINQLKVNLEQKITINTLNIYPGAGDDTHLITGLYNYKNEKNIMKSWGVLFDGKYRESLMDVGVLNYVDKYARSSGNGPDGQHFYNFGLRTDPREFQPTGAVNLSKFKDIEFEIDVLPPPLANEAKTFTVCNDVNEIIGINKSVWDIYKYCYDLTVLEERYNILTFASGNASLMYAR